MFWMVSSRAVLRFEFAGARQQLQWFDNAVEMICSPFIMHGAPGSLDFSRSDPFAEHDQRVRVLLWFGRRVERTIFVRELLNTCGDQKSVHSFAFALDNHTSLDKSSDEFPTRPIREKMRGCVAGQMAARVCADVRCAVVPDFYAKRPAGYGSEAHLEEVWYSGRSFSKLIAVLYLRHGA